MLRRIVVAVCLLVAAVPVLEGVAPAAGSFEAGGSVNQVYVTGLTPGDEVDLLDADDDEVASGVADGAGALLFREIQAGTGYQVRSDGTTVGGLAVTDPDAHPDPAWYATEAAAHPVGISAARASRNASGIVTSMSLAATATRWRAVVNWTRSSAFESEKGIRKCAERIA